MSPKSRVSVGVFIQNIQGQWLLGHATGQKHFDIFKGMPEPNESPIETALRELQEETGIIIASNALEDTGLHSYRADKKLHIFKTFLEVDPSQLKCTSFFEHPVSQTQTAEMDGFFWYTPIQAREKAVPRLWAILDKLSGPSLMPCTSSASPSSL